MFIGLIWVHEKSPAKQANLYLDIGVGILAGVLLGSRIVFVIFQWNYFNSHKNEILQFQLGGYSWVGAIIGWIIAILIASRMTHYSVLELGDVFLPLEACLVIGVWLGCWFEGIAYGFLSEKWWAMPAVDEWGEISNRFPVQLIGALSALFVMMVIDGIKYHPVWKQWLRIPGKSTALFLSALSLILFLLTFFRDDPAPFWMGCRLDAWISSGFFIISVILFGVIELKHKLPARKSGFEASGF